VNVAAARSSLGQMPGPRPPGPAQRILHVDMDAFYASVEVLDDSALAGKPVIVGGTDRRGVVASCSYEARAFGVRSAMPTAQARRRCPHAVFLPGRHARYAEISTQIHAVFERYTPLVEGISLDEAFLDVTGSERLFGPAVTIAARIRGQIATELHLACSVGVAPVKFLAKLASEAAKPRATGNGIDPGAGVVVVEPGEELRFLHPLPIESLCGVGPATGARLHRLGITTIGELAAVPSGALEAALGQAHGSQLARLARGIDDRHVEPNRELKSVSHEETYPVDLYAPDDLERELLRMAEAVAARTRRARLLGRTVTVKVRFGDYVTRTRSRTFRAGVCDGRSIAETAHDLLDGVDLYTGVRLLGVGLSNLVSHDERDPTLWEQMRFGLDDGQNPEIPGPLAPGHVEPSAAPRSDATRAADAVRARYGEAAVGPAARLISGESGGLRASSSPWGPNRVAGHTEDPEQTAGAGA
jgi:DNA polymerase-4